jgi:adenylate kinase
MTSSPVYFIIGGPGSGKGTVCDALVKDFGFTHFSAGDMLRIVAKEDTELGAKIAGILAAGQIVPSEVTVAMLMEAIAKTPNPTGYIIDGFPRKLDQAQMFEDVCRSSGIVYLDCEEAIMEKRLLDRAAAGSGRTDDNIETIRRRFKVNQVECMPVVDKYKAEERLTTIQSGGSKEEVYADVQKVFSGKFNVAPTSPAKK